jgi:hypothetical protein
MTGSMSDFTYLKKVFDDFLLDANLVRYKKNFSDSILNRKLSEITLTDLEDIGLLQFHQKRFIRNAKKLSKEKEGQINLYFLKKRHKELLEEGRHKTLQREQDARKIKENRDKSITARAEEDARYAKSSAKVIKLATEKEAQWRYEYPMVRGFKLDQIRGYKKKKKSKNLKKRKDKKKKPKKSKKKRKKVKDSITYFDSK